MRARQPRAARRPRVQQSLPVHEELEACPLFDEPLGLERADALRHDIRRLHERFGLVAPPEPEEGGGPGDRYARLLHGLRGSRARRLCHTYNVYAAQAAGGALIGSQIQREVLDGWEGAFYRYASDPKALLEALRERIDAEPWTAETDLACVTETPAAFAGVMSITRCLETYN